MQDTSSVPSEVAWLGVTEIFDKKRNGLFRANWTTAIFVAFILLTYVGLRWVGGPVWPPAIFLFFGSVAALTWALSFVFGYYGVAYTGLGDPLVSGVTANTDLGPRLNMKSFAFGPPFSDPKAFRAAWTDLSYGRLVVSATGVAGIVSILWRDVRSISQVNSQTVCMAKRSKLFFVPIGARPVLLHFSTPDDCVEFLDQANSRMHAYIPVSP